MLDSPRLRRLRADLKALEQLKSESRIFDFQPFGSPPEQYVLHFRGRGVFRAENSTDVLPREHHEVLLKLNAGYPRNVPSLTWRTPILHPNIATSGVVCLGGYGSHWAPSIGLDELCRMLWDMIRYANYDPDSPYNREAAYWVRENDKFKFPLDPRPLRDVVAGQSTSASGHAKRIDAPSPPVRMHRPAVRSAAPIQAEVVFLDDAVITAEVVGGERAATEREEILYIQ